MPSSGGPSGRSIPAAEASVGSQSVKWTMSSTSVAPPGRPSGHRRIMGHADAALQHRSLGAIEPAVVPGWCRGLTPSGTWSYRRLNAGPLSQLNMKMVLSDRPWRSNSFHDAPDASVHHLRSVAYVMATPLDRPIAS